MVFGFNLFEHCKVKPQISLRHTALYPGNILEGVVILNVTAPVEYTAVRVKLCGKERVHIVKQESHGQGKHRKTSTKHYKESVCVYKQLITIAGIMKSQGSGGFFSSKPRLTMPAGQWNYPFAIQLPMNIPPSFSKKVSNDYAEIVYYIKAYVDIPMGRDAAHRAHFSVIRPMPISQHLQKMPFQTEKSFDVKCCWCIDKGKVRAKMFMDRTVIAIDRDYLNVHFELDNTDGQEPIESMEITLRQDIKYTAQAHHERKSLVVGKNFIRKAIPAGQKDILSGVIPISRNLVPSLTTSHILSQYAVQVEINIPYASDPSVLINVIVAQTVDESNYSPVVNWNENKYTTIAKGQTSVPETYYVPPPKPAFPAQPLPFAPPPSAAVFSYNFASAPMGLPSQQWQQQSTMVEGAPATVQPLGAAWSSGYDQRYMPDVTPPPPPPNSIMPEGMLTTPPPGMQQQQQCSAPQSPYPQQQQQGPSSPYPQQQQQGTYYQQQQQQGPSSPYPQQQQHDYYQQQQHSPPVNQQQQKNDLEQGLL